MKCVVCLTVRNCEKFLTKIFKNIQILYDGLDKQLSVIFSYDNCQDNSVELMKKFKNEFDGPVFIIQNKFQDFHYRLKMKVGRFGFGRTHRIACARNTCLNFIKKNLKDTDFHIMMDADDVCSRKINIEIIKKYLIRNDWDCLSFNRKIYYDIWALLYGPHIHHCHGWTDHHNKNAVIIYLFRDITTRLSSLKKDELFECYSAFNGFAIYRTKKFLNIKYNSSIKFFFGRKKLEKYVKYMRIKLKRPSLKMCSTEENCEHISFHLSALINNKAKIRISKEYVFYE